MLPLQGEIAVSIGLTSLIIVVFLILITSGKEKQHQEANKDDH